MFPFVFVIVGTGVISLFFLSRRSHPAGFDADSVKTRALNLVFFGSIYLLLTTSFLNVTSNSWIGGGVFLGMLGGIAFGATEIKAIKKRCPNFDGQSSEEAHFVPTPRPKWGVTLLASLVILAIAQVPVFRRTMTDLQNVLAFFLFMFFSLVFFWGFSVFVWARITIKSQIGS